MVIPVEKQIMDYVQVMGDADKTLVLSIVRSIASRPKGLSGQEFIDQTSDIRFLPEQLQEMQKAIDEEFGYSDEM